MVIFHLVIDLIMVVVGVETEMEGEKVVHFFVRDTEMAALVMSASTCREKPHMLSPYSTIEGMPFMDIWFI